MRWHSYWTARQSIASEIIKKDNSENSKNISYNISPQTPITISRIDIKGVRYQV